MSFTHRALQIKDLEACFSMLWGREIYGGPMRRELLSLWKFLVEEEACVSTVIEDSRFPAGRRQVSFGLSVFLTDDFMERAKTHLPPFLAPQIFKEWRGKKRPFLLRSEIARESSKGGLNLFALHYGWDGERLTPEEAFRARSLLQERFLADHSGYGIKEMMHEALGAEIRGLVEAAGEKLVRDYGEHWGDLLLRKAGEKHRPFLTACTRDEAFRQPGSFVALFWSRYYPSQFGFTLAEKKTLDLALQGETDEEIARSLHLSPWTVKKRWQGIYDKVSRAQPDLLSERSGRKTGGGRTRQRRRFLLEYLRNHPEELRPSVKARARKR